MVQIFWNEEFSSGGKQEVVFSLVLTFSPPRLQYISTTKKKKTSLGAQVTIYDLEKMV